MTKKAHAGTKKAKSPKRDEATKSEFAHSLPKGVNASRLYIAIREEAVKVAIENGCPEKIVPQILDMMDNMAYQAIGYFYQILGDTDSSPKVYQIQKILGSILVSNADTFVKIKERPDWPELEKENEKIGESIIASQYQEITVSEIERLFGKKADTDNEGCVTFGIGLPKPDPKGTLH